jgi:hypothetical protein
MESKNFKVSTAGHIQTSTGLILMDGLWLFVSLLFFLAFLGWATWEMRLVNPMAFTMFAGSMAAVLALAIADVWSHRTCNVSVLSLKPASESGCLTTPVDEQIKVSRPIKDIPLTPL